MTRSEWRWLLVTSAAVVLVTSAPYLIGLARSTPEHPFSGVLLLSDDLYSYFAKMRVGASGEWLYQNPYAVEAHPSAPIYLFYLAIGKVAALGAGSKVPVDRLVMVYHITRAMLGYLLLVVLYPVLGLLIAEPRQRQLAWMLAALGGGLGWAMLLILKEPLPFGSAPIDLYVGEAVMYVPLLILPHLLMARAALLGGVLCFVWAVEQHDWRWALAAGGCWLIATIGVPFDILVAGSIVGGWLTARWILTQRVPWLIAGLGLLAGAPGIVFALSTLWLIRGDPVYVAWNAQNLLPLPHPAHLVSAYGVQTVLALVGAVVSARGRTAHADLFVGWLIASPLLWLIPVPFRLRLIEGFIVPLSAAAVVGLLHLTRSWQRLFRNAAIAGLFAVLLPSGLFVLIGSIALAVSGGMTYSPDQTAALDWLRRNASEGAVVLSSANAGVLLPAFAPVRVVAGHGFETPDFAGKESAVIAYYQTATPDDQRRALIEQYDVRYVWFGPDERALACAAAECTDGLRDHTAMGLHPVFSVGEITIYEADSK